MLTETAAGKVCGLARVVAEIVQSHLSIGGLGLSSSGDKHARSTISDRGVVPGRKLTARFT
jgi:hypothetical protein